MSQAWQQTRQQASPHEAKQPIALPDNASDPIATVNGQAIGRDQLFRLLMAGRGVDVLEQLIVLEVVCREADTRGITVTASDVDAEYDTALRSLLSTLPAADEKSFDREAGERLLDEILAGRGVSREEYRLGIVRNAYLRRLALARMQFSEGEVREEFSRSYGERVGVRHIQLAGRSDADRVQRELAAGADFGEVARRYSANAATAPGGGLLRPFSRDDPDVPALLRETAFQLAAGQVSNPIRVDAWYHVIRVEERLPAGERSLDEVRDELADRVRQRRVAPAMQALSIELFDRARVEIVDPALESAFFKRHPDLRRSGP
ncbi:MAG TPA: peptidyl-prolyl cis-trans isomerase [Phycisphaerae bacterium]|nr:peptidyl-prolyl cis-trans isomerase [Phycisphaerae bacterium]